MIILRKVNTSSSMVVSGDLTGTKNGINQVFLTDQAYETNEISVSYNGQVLYSPTDFSETGEKEITFLYLSPDSTDIIKATYKISTS